MKPSSFVTRLLLYKVNRGIAQSERITTLKKRFREQQKDVDKFVAWATKHPNHPLVERVNKQVEKVMHDLELNELPRAKKLGTIFSNAWRLAQEVPTPPPLPGEGRGLPSWLRNLW
jgi:hypothetical protein